MGMGNMVAYLQQLLEKMLARSRFGGGWQGLRRHKSVEFGSIEGSLRGSVGALFLQVPSRVQVRLPMRPPVQVA